MDAHAFEGTELSSEASGCLINAATATRQAFCIPARSNAAAGHSRPDQPGNDEILIT